MVAAVVQNVLQIKKTQREKLFPFGEFNAIANAMDNSGVQDIFFLDTEGIQRICVRLTVATNALAALQVSALFSSEDTTSVTLASVATDYTVPKGLMVGASGDLTTLAVGSGWFIMDVTGISKLKISANSSAAGGSTLALNAGGQ